MSKPRQYLSTNDKFNFLIDNSLTMFQIKLDANEGSAFERLPFTSRGYYRHSIIDGAEELTVKKLKHMYLIQVRVNYNFNRNLRNHYKEILGLKRLRSSYGWGDNVIPSEIRILLEANEIGIPEVRQEGFRLYFDYCNRVKTAMAEWLEKNHNIAWPVCWVSQYLQMIEIDWDILTLPEITLAEDFTIKRRFNEVADGILKKCKFSDNGKSARIILNNPKHNKLTDAWESANEKEPKMLVGWIRSDGSRIRLYVKEWGNQAAINRMERRFEGRNCLIKHIRKNTIVDDSDFLTKINLLAEASFPINYQILSVKSYFSSKQKLKLLRQALRRHGGKYFHEMYRAIIAKGTIHSGGKSTASLRAMARRVVLLNRHGIIFKRKSSGIYDVNWDWVLAVGKKKIIVPQRKPSPAKEDLKKFGWWPIAERTTKAQIISYNGVCSNAPHEAEFEDEPPPLKPNSWA